MRGFDYCILGWVDFRLFYIFNKRAPAVCCVLFKSKENEKKFCFDPVTLFTMLALCLSKDAEFYVDFKNIQLPQRHNAPKKSYSKEVVLNWDYS
jgi:hypothetical protein